MKLLTGKEPASEIKKKLAAEIKKLAKKPTLAVILIGDNPASEKYVQKKKEEAEKIGIGFKLIKFDKNIDQNLVYKEIQELNNDPGITGIIVQLPLPNELNEVQILEKIAPEKDVDGLHPLNQGYLMQKKPALNPATPEGVIEMLKFYKIPIIGKGVIIVGRSNLVGNPLGQLFLKEDATVTIAHSKSQNLGEVTKTADILVSAVGRPVIIKGGMVKDGFIGIDVGTTSVNGKLKGDFDFESVSKKASYLTPVPGGVGPMTVAMLLSNVVKAAKLIN
ncbi:MAG: bifunctional methylenetetrahydrofolate dehydrogenase/methenyltetrahydrofolate cyclohydrolase [Patescibacteria group bacterium]|nr:bifunctional methylenetetrahydrofolate dehydrogenase/methenyltetrahydrofolate cyclohydrolase [Patescibacteria group bacterium]